MKSREVFTRLFRNWSIKIGSIIAAIILFYVNKINTMEQHELEVALKVFTPPEYALAEPYLEKVRLQIRGQKDRNVMELTADDFRVTADLTTGDPHQWFTRNQVILSYEKRGKALEAGPLEVNLYPPSIQVRLEERVEKVVPVQANWSGELPEGYTWVAHQLSPPEVTITGPASRVNKVQFITTQSLDISDKQSDFFLTLPLILPDEMVRVKDSPSVGFTGLVTEILFTRVIREISLVGINLPENLTIVKTLEKGKMEIRASNYILKNLRTDLLRIIVDCSNIDRAGKYMLKTVPELPEGVFLINHEPKEVLVDFAHLPE